MLATFDTFVILLILCLNDYYYYKLLYEEAFIFEF